jgi:hypothetical protein
VKQDGREKWRGTIDSTLSCTQDKFGLPLWPSKGGAKISSMGNIELVRGDDDGGR